MVKLREARSKRKNSKESDKKKKAGKIRQFAQCFIHLFISTVFNPVAYGEGGGGGYPTPS